MDNSLIVVPGCVGSQVLVDGDLGEVLFAYEVGGELMYIVRLSDSIILVNSWDTSDVSDCWLCADDLGIVADMFGEDEDVCADMVADMGYSLV